MRTVIYFCVSLVIVVSLFVSPANAQKWSAEQLEVWSVEEQLYAAFAKSDIDAAAAFLHPDYMGWSYGAPVPYGKDSWIKWVKYFTADEEVVIYELTPLAIQVFGDYAFVDYLYMGVEKDKPAKGEKVEDDDEDMTNARWTDIFLKQDGKWLLVGDHGGEKPSGGDDD